MKIKKTYITPTIIVEQTDNDDMLMASNRGDATAFWGEEGNEDSQSEAINGTGNNDDFVQGAKGMGGNFAFCEDFEYSIDM